MQSPFMIGIICVLSTIVSALNSDLTSSFNDDNWILQDTNNLPLDQTGSLFGVPSSSESLSQDTSSNKNLFSENDDDFLLSSLSDDSIGNDNGAVFDGTPSEIASCSSSTPLEDFPPAIGKKSRLRRRDGSNGICKTSNEAPGSFSSSDSGEDGFPDLSVPNALFHNPTAMLFLTGDMTDNRKNRYCHWLTGGLLPFGVCSIGDIPSERMSLTDTLTLDQFGQFGLWTVGHCTLAPDVKLTCPDPGTYLFCCRYVEPLGTIYSAGDCILLLQAFGFGRGGGG